jgi:hypothetical protein
MLICRGIKNKNALSPCVVICGLLKSEQDFELNFKLIINMALSDKIFINIALSELIFINIALSELIFINIALYIFFCKLLYVFEFKRNNNRVV